MQRIQELDIGECVIAYSDIPYLPVMTVGAIAQAPGVGYTMMDPKDT